MQDLRDLNVLEPDEVTRVTEYGPEIVQFVEKIVQNGFGYVTSDGSVYLDIEAFENAGHRYARLEPWNRNNQRLQRDGEGALTKAAEEKNPPMTLLFGKRRSQGSPAGLAPGAQDDQAGTSSSRPWRLVDWGARLISIPEASTSPSRITTTSLRRVRLTGRRTASG